MASRPPKDAEDSPAHAGAVPWFLLDARFLCVVEAAVSAACRMIVSGAKPQALDTNASTTTSFLQSNAPIHRLPWKSRRVRAAFPRVPADAPRTCGDFPRTRGNFPRSRGTFPWVRGDLPRVLGNLPRTRWNSQRTLGDFPRTRWNSPRTRKSHRRDHFYTENRLLDARQVPCGAGGRVKDKQ
jgi:hypothetical protein